MARVGAWVGASTADMVVRLATQMVGTVVIARLLPAEDFGYAMLSLSVVALLGAFVGLPFEEALAQRGRIRTGHLSSALFASLALSVAAILLVLLLAKPLQTWADAPGLALWLPVATIFLLAQGPGSISRALARRQRRFVELALCQSLSVIIATVVSIGLAVAGMGILALVLQRMLPVALYPLFAAIASVRRGGGAYVRPVFIRARFNEILRFSWIYLANTGVHYAIPAVMTFIVNAQFGTAVLGQLNIAMRLAEPVRAGIQGVGHNLVFSHLARMQSDARRLVGSAFEVVTQVASLAVPAFLGLAVVAPLVLPILVGPGWDEAAPLAQAFCIVAAINVPFLYLFSGFSALGRPEFELGAVSLALAVMVGGLLLAADAGSRSGIGVAVIATEATVAAVGVIVATCYLGREAISPIWRVARIWLASGAMALVLSGALPRLEMVGIPFFPLAATVLLGALLYPPLLFLICRPCFEFLDAMILRRKRYGL